MPDTLWLLAKWSEKEPNCPARRASFWLARNEPRATVAGHFERMGCPGATATAWNYLFLDAGLRRHDVGMMIVISKTMS